MSRIYDCRIFGSIPGPVAFGSLFDHQCLLMSGSCLFYDNDALADSVVAFSVGMCSGLRPSVFSLFLIFVSESPLARLLEEVIGSSLS